MVLSLFGTGEWFHGRKFSYGEGFRMIQVQYIYCELHFHYSYIAQLVKNLPTKEETQVHFLVWEDPLEKGIASNSSQFQCSCLENPRVGGAWWAVIYGVAKSWTQLSN